MPDNIDTDFLVAFRDLILSTLDTHQYVLVCGGGKTARRYQDGLKSVNADATDDSLDWVGIYSSHLNAHLVKHIFGDHAAPEIVTDPHVALQQDAAITIAAGWKPGFSTDFDAVEIALNNGFETVVNLSNITHVYDKDPNTHDDAVPLEDIAWPDFQKLVGETWTPGLSMPFDPIATKRAAEADLDVVIASGDDIANIRAIIEGKPFIGTRIHS